METPLLESLFNKAAPLQVCHFIKKKLQLRCFPVIIAKYLRITIGTAATVYSEALLKSKNCVIKNTLPESF